MGSDSSWAVIQKVFEGSAKRRGTDIEAALKFARNVQRRRAVVVVVSDFLDGNGWDQVMGALCRRHKVHAICVHDPLDKGIAGLGLVEIMDAETGRRRLVTGRSWAATHGVEARIARLRRVGARAVAISTTEDPFVALHGYFQRQARR